MPSSDRPEPGADWPTRPGLARVVAGAVFLGVCVAVSGVGALAGLAGQDRQLTRYAALATTAFALVLAHGVVLAHGLTRTDRPTASGRAVVLGEDQGTPATVLVPSGTLFGLLVAVMSVLGLVFLSAALDVLGRDPGDLRLGAAAVFVLIGAYFLGFPVSVAAGRVTRGQVMLSARGIRQRGRAFESFVAWESIVGVRVVQQGRTPGVLVLVDPAADWRRRPTTRWWRLDRLPPSPMILIDCSVFALDPVVLHRVVATYVNDPALRSELGTPAGLARCLAL